MFKLKLELSLGNSVSHECFWISHILGSMKQDFFCIVTLEYMWFDGCKFCEKSRLWQSSAFSPPLFSTFLELNHIIRATCIYMLSVSKGLLFSHLLIQFVYFLQWAGFFLFGMFHCCYVFVCFIIHSKL